MTSENAAPQPPVEPNPAQPAPPALVLLSPDAQESMKDRWLWVGLLVLLAATAFIPAIRGGFIWQDDREVTNNVLVAAPDALSQIWTGHLSEVFSSPAPNPTPGTGDDAVALAAAKLPVTPHFQPLGYTLLWLEYQAWGVEAFGYHAVQVGLHAASIILLWLVLRNLRVPGAWVIAAVCAVHPLAAESVSWVSQTPLVLGVALMLGAILFYIESAGVTNGELRGSWIKFAVNDSPTSHTIALVLFAGAVLAQPTLAPVALVVPLLLWGVGKQLDGKEWGRIVPMAVIGGAALAMYAAVELHSALPTHAYGRPPTVEVPAVGLSAWFFLSKIFFPLGLCFDYGIENAGVVGWIGLAAMLAVVVALGVRGAKGPAVWRGAAVVVGSYVLLLLPRAGLVPTTDHATRLVADLFAYPAHLAVIVGVVALVARSVGAIGVEAKRAQGVFAVAGVVLVGLTALTWSRAAAYADASELWNDTIARNPKSYLAHYELGTLLIDDGATLYQQAEQLRSEGMTDDAAQQAKDSATSFSEAEALLKRATELRPDSIRAKVALGLVRYRRGEYDSAEQTFRDVLAVAPNDSRANYNLGLVLIRKYQSTPQLMALAQRLQFERSMPTVAEWIYRRLGDRQDWVDAALMHFQKAVESDPTLGDAMFEQGMIYRELGQDEKAVTAFQQALAVKPNFVNAHRELARLFRNYGQYRESLFHLTAVYRLSPASAQLQAEMGTAVGLLGNFQVAKEWFQQALAIQPDNKEAKLGLKIAEQALAASATMQSGANVSTRPATQPLRPVQIP